MCSQAHQSLFTLPPSTWWAAVELPQRKPSGKSAIPYLIQDSGVDRRLAQKNLRTGLVAAAIILVVFAAAFLTGYIY